MLLSQHACVLSDSASRELSDAVFAQLGVKLLCSHLLGATVLVVVMGVAVDPRRVQKCTLHVRSRNVPALKLYKTQLGFTQWTLEKGYYPDEDAFTVSGLVRAWCGVRVGVRACACVRASVCA